MSLVTEVCHYSMPLTTHVFLASSNVSYKNKEELFYSPLFSLYI